MARFGSIPKEGGLGEDLWPSPYAIQWLSVTPRFNDILAAPVSIPSCSSCSLLRRRLAADCVSVSISCDPFAALRAKPVRSTHQLATTARAALRRGRASLRLAGLLELDQRPAASQRNERHHVTRRQVRFGREDLRPGHHPEDQRHGQCDPSHLEVSIQILLPEASISGRKNPTVRRATGSFLMMPRKAFFVQSEENGRQITGLTWIEETQPPPWPPFAWGARKCWGQGWGMRT